LRYCALAPGFRIDAERCKKWKSMWIIQDYYVSFIMCRKESFELDLLEICLCFQDHLGSLCSSQRWVDRASLSVCGTSQQICFQGAMSFLPMLGLNCRYVCGNELTLCRIAVDHTAMALDLPFCWLHQKWLLTVELQ
jgi:hypothetical protein